MAYDRFAVFTVGLSLDYWVGHEMYPDPLGLFYHSFSDTSLFVRNTIFADRHKVVQMYVPWEWLITETQDVTYSGWAKSFTTNWLSGKGCQ